MGERVPWENDSWTLYQGNVPVDNALSVKQFLEHKSIPILKHPLYLPDLAPSDFNLFSEVKTALK